MHLFNHCPAQRVGCLIALVLLAANARAETSRIGTLPRKPGLAGFVMTAEIEVVAGNGYQPVYLRFSPLGKTFLRDRHLQVEIRPRHYGTTGLDFSYRRSIRIAEDSTTHTAVAYVPHYFPWESVQVSLLENGRRIETGEQLFTLGNGLRSRFAEQTSSVGIIASSDLSDQDAAWKVYPDVRTLVTVLGDGPIPEDAGVHRLAHQAAFKRAHQVQTAWVQFRPIDEANLHDQWLGYSQLDVILVAAPVLARIESQQPTKFEHLMNWLASGGNLWVYAAADDSSLAFISRLGRGAVDQNRILAPKSVAGLLNLKSDNDTSSLLYEPWNGVRKESTQYAYQTNNKKLLGRGDVFETLESKKHPFAQTVSKAEIARGIGISSCGLGKVVTIAADDPFPGSFQFWKSIVRLSGDGQLVWSERMGIDVPKGNDNYWMWLIRSVGQPPVKSFVFLNTLFVLLVGPICYFFFRKRQRLYLLYFMAPCLATLVTVSLFAYALGVDGTKTKLRARQLTWLDSKSGFAVAQTRQTYYAVFGSGGGLKFPSDAAVYPVTNTPVVDRYYRRGGRSSGQRELAVTSEAQHFGGAFLPPRNQVQYLVNHPHQTTQSLTFSFGEKQHPNNAILVTNHLGYALHRLLVRDADGNYWTSKRISAGTSSDLIPSDASVLGELLGPDVLPPLGAVPMLQNNRRTWGGAGTGVQVSLLENRLEKWSSGLPPKSFVAVADLIDDGLGVDEAIVLDSVHVIMGEIP